MRADEGAGLGNRSHFPWRYNLLRILGGETCGRMGVRFLAGTRVDSLHIACAERAVAVLLITDDGLITFFKSHRDIQVQRENPVIWLTEKNR